MSLSYFRRGSVIALAIEQWGAWAEAQQKENKGDRTTAKMRKGLLATMIISSLKKKTSSSLGAPKLRLR